MHFLCKIFLMNWEKLKVFKKVAKAGSFLTASKQIINPNQLFQER